MYACLVFLVLSFFLPSSSWYDGKGKRESVCLFVCVRERERDGWELGIRLRKVDERVYSGVLRKNVSFLKCHDGVD